MENTNPLTGHGSVDCSPTKHPSYVGLTGDALTAAKKATSKTFLFSVTFDSQEAMLQRAVESVSRLVATPARQGKLDKFAGSGERIKVAITLNEKGDAKAQIEGISSLPSTDTLLAMLTPEQKAELLAKLQS
jgi:hypothetical protein